MIRSISTDISAAFVLISQHAEAGHLEEKHTAPINTVLEVINKTELSQREGLEESVRKYQRRTRRMRKERAWLKKEFTQVVEEIEEVSGIWKDRVKRLESVWEELAEVRKECEILRAAKGMKDDGKGARMVPLDNLASPMEMDTSETVVDEDDEGDGTGSAVS